MDTTNRTPALSDAQRTFATQRIEWLDHALRLIKIGKPGINQLARELRAERDNIQTHLIADSIRDFAEKGAGNV